MPIRLLSCLRRKASRDHPAWWTDYLRLHQDRLSGQTPLAEIPFTVIDTETTGLEKGNRHLLAVGGVKVRGGRILVENSWECRIRQVYDPATSAVEVHGLLPGTEGALEIEEALRRTIRFIGSDVLVGHGVDFDRRVFNEALQGLGAGPLKNPVVDTLRLAKRLERPNLTVPAGYHGLDELCRRYGIRPADRHTAAGDAFLTAQLLLKLLARLEDRRVRAWGDLRGRTYW